MGEIRSDVKTGVGEDDKDKKGWDDWMDGG